MRGKYDCSGAKVFVRNANLVDLIENAPFTHPLDVKPLHTLVVS